MIFRIGGLLMAGALCVLVILVANSDNHNSQPLVVFAKPPTRIHAGSEVMLCAKAENRELLKKVRFQASSGSFSLLFSYTGSESPNKKVLDGGVLTFKPQCRTYYAPQAVNGMEEVIPIFLILKGNTEDVLYLKVFDSSP